MNLYQKSKLASHRVAITYLDRNTATTSHFAEFDDEKAELDADMAEAETVVAKLEHETAGVAMSKEELRMTAELSCKKLCKKMTIFAKRRKMPDLVKALKTSMLSRLSDEDLPGKITDLADLAAEYKTDAALFGVSTVLITEVRADNTAYKNAVPMPRLSKTDVATLNARFKVLQKSIDGHFDVIDSMVDGDMDTYPEFGAGYFNARKIVDLVGGHLSMKLQVNDAASGAGLKGAVLEIAEQPAEGKEAGSPELTKSVKKTGAKGGAMAKGLNTGKYVIKVTKAGFVTQTLIVYVNEGEMTKVVVEMVRV